MASLYGIALDEFISFDAAVSGLRQAIEKTNGQAEGAVDWTANGERDISFSFAAQTRGKCTKLYPQLRRHAE